MHVHPDVERSRRLISRRRLLASAGTVAVGSLIGACTGDEPSSTGSTTDPAHTTPTSTSTTGSPTAGSTATSTSTGSADLVALLDRSSTCELTPEQTEGPYYLDVDAIRRDIREDRPGAPLRLAVRAQDSSCEPLPAAVVEIWHCDAGGVYSGVQGDVGTYLRGSQVTGDDGIAQFTTIYPGWYPGRSVHIHFKIFVSSAEVLTSQFFFDEDFTDGVYGRELYTSHSGDRTLNSDDGIYDDALVVDAYDEADGVLAVKNVMVAADS